MKIEKTDLIEIVKGHTTKILELQRKVEEIEKEGVIITIEALKKISKDITDLKTEMEKTKEALSSKAAEALEAKILDLEKLKDLLAENLKKAPQQPESAGEVEEIDLDFLAEQVAKRLNMKRQQQPAAVKEPKKRGGVLAVAAGGFLLLSAALATGGWWYLKSHQPHQKTAPAKAVKSQKKVEYPVKEAQKEAKRSASTSSLVCEVLKDDEILYYLKDGKKLVPIYKAKGWNGKGVRLRKGQILKGDEVRMGGAKYLKIGVKVLPIDSELMRCRHGGS